MAGLFDPSMFDPSSFGNPQASMIARLAGMAGYRPTPQSILPGQPGTDAMASGMPPQGPPMTQQAPPMAAPQGLPQMGASSGLLSSMFGNQDGGGFLNGLHNALQAHQGQLMGAAQLVGSGGLNQKALTEGMNQDYQRNLQQSTLGQTYQALRDILPEPLARAATLNPELLKTIAPEYFSAPKVVQTGESPLGKTFQLQSAGGKFSDIPNGGGGGNVGMSLLGPGIKQMDPSLQGDAYMQQFGPEVQAAAKAYINGDVMPTGNPRQQGIGNFAKTVAQKWGADTGQPVSDITYAQKRKMQVDMASSGNSSMGGILANGKSAFAHLADTSDKLADLGNYSSDIPIVGGAAATFGNYVGNKITPTSDTKGKLAAANDALGHYGQESTKFYAGSGGGVEERQRALKDANPTSASGAEQAAYLETEKGLMLDRLQQKENQIRETMGDGFLQAHPVMTKELQGTIQRIDANIAKLRGQAPAATQPTTGTPDAQGWVTLPGGVRIREKK